MIYHILSAGTFLHLFDKNGSVQCRTKALPVHPYTGSAPVDQTCFHIGYDPLRASISARTSVSSTTSYSIAWASSRYAYDTCSLAVVGSKR